VKRWLCLPLALLVSGCTEAYFEALTVPPPNRTADLDASEESARVSVGVALAFECTYGSAPCANATISSDDGSVAAVFPAYMDLLSDTIYDDRGDRVGKKARTVFVLLGVQPGTTEMVVAYEVDGDAAEQSFDVEVVP
jgi:hypothetical protein